MTAVWEGEGSVGPSALTALTAPTHWEWEEAFEDISGMSLVLRFAFDVIEIVATPKPATHKFEALFDNRRLDDAGFGSGMDFETRVKLVVAALRGDESLSATLKADSGGLKLLARMQMAAFKVDYALPLKRAEFGECDILKAKLRTTEQRLAESRALVADLQQINLELMQRMDAAVAKGDATHKQLAAAKTNIEALEQRLAKSKEQFAAFKTEIEALMTEIRIRDARIGELEKILAKPVISTVAKTSTQFLFDSSIFGGRTKPSLFQVSADGKSANAKEYYAQMVLTPAVTSDCQLKLVVEKMTGLFYVGITDDYSKHLYNGCGFDSNGNVYVNGSRVAVSQPFGDWRIGGRLLLKAHLRSGTVIIESRTGKYTAKWKPTKEPIFFAMLCSKGTALRID